MKVRFSYGDLWSSTAKLEVDAPFPPSLGMVIYFSTAYSGGDYVKCYNNKVGMAVEPVGWNFGAEEVFVSLDLHREPALGTGDRAQEKLEVLEALTKSDQDWVIKE